MRSICDSHLPTFTRARWHRTRTFQVLHCSYCCCKSDYSRNVRVCPASTAVYLHRLVSLIVLGVLRSCVCIDYCCCNKTSTFFLDCEGWVSIAPLPPPRILRSTDQLQDSHDKLHAYHVALLHAACQLSTENDGGYQTRRGQHGMAAPVATHQFNRRRRAENTIFLQSCIRE